MLNFSGMDRSTNFHEFYHLKALITLEHVNTSMVEKKNLHMQNFDCETNSTGEFIFSDDWNDT